MPTPNRLEFRRQLLVEGRDQWNFFQALISHMNIDDIQIQDFGGVNDLTGFVMNLVEMGEFNDSVESMGIVRDAEVSATSAFQSVQSSLDRAGLPIPDRPMEPTNSLPSISVMILPDDHSPGMLETLLCRSFAGSGLDSCIDSFFECIQDELGYGPHRPEKARAHAYIATRRDPHVSVGVAAQRSYWDLDHAVFDGVRSFLRSL